MSFFELNSDKCKKDGVCAKVCVAGIIKNDENRTPFIAENRESFCISCGLCVAFCPHDACSVANLDKSQFINLDKLNKPDEVATVQFLKSRRSVRQFKQAELPKDIIESILDVARYAPSAKNSQKVRWVAVSNRQEMHRLGSLIAEFFEQKDIEDAKHANILARAFKSGNDVFLRSAPNLIAAIVPKDYAWKEDGSIALTYLELAAHAKNIGACWGGYFTTAARRYKPIQDMLGVKDDEYICGAQLLGYPIYKQHAIPSRKKLDISFI